MSAFALLPRKLPNQPTELFYRKRIGSSILQSTERRWTTRLNISSTSCLEYFLTEDLAFTGIWKTHYSPHVWKNNSSDSVIISETRLCRSLLHFCTLRFLKHGRVILISLLLETFCFLAAANIFLISEIVARSAFPSKTCVYFEECLFSISKIRDHR